MFGKKKREAAEDTANHATDVEKLIAGFFTYIQWRDVEAGGDYDLPELYHDNLRQIVNGPDEKEED